MQEKSIIRKAEAKDAEEIYKIICKMEGEKPAIEQFNKIYFENLKRSNTYYYIAEKNGILAGFISMDIRNRLRHTAKTAEIIEMFVLPEYRNEGIGEDLYWKLKDIAIEKGCKFFEVSCNIVRERSVIFFEKLGFQHTHYKFTEYL